MQDSAAADWQHTMDISPPVGVNQSTWQERTQECHDYGDFSTGMDLLHYCKLSMTTAINSSAPQSTGFLPQTKPRHKSVLLQQDSTRAADHTQTTIAAQMVNKMTTRKWLYMKSVVCTPVESDVEWQTRHLIGPTTA